MASPRSALLLTLLAVASAAAPAQRPKTAAQALTRYQQARDGNEASRRRAVGDLGPFADAAVTRALLEELTRAEGGGFRSTVVRALGGCERPDPPGVIAALREVLVAAANPRLAEDAARGLAAQGGAGVMALGALLGDSRPGPLRTAVCRGLERCGDERTRDLLIDALRQSGGKDRLPPFEALAGRSGDAVVDALRVELAGDKQIALASAAVAQLAAHGHPEVGALALQLSRRLPDDAFGADHAAVLHGLLIAVEPAAFEPILRHASRADGAFGAALAPAWLGALADDAFFAFVTTRGPRLAAAADRRAAVLALGLTPTTRGNAPAEALATLLSDRDDAVVAAAAAGLVRFGAASARPPLLELLRGDRESGKAAALAALHELAIDDPAWPETLLGHAGDRSPLVAATALRLLARRPEADRARALAALSAALAHDAWAVRAAAIELGVALRDKAVVPLLIERVDREHARLLADVREALAALTGQRFADGASWRTWWQREGDGFTVRPAPAAGERGGGQRGGAATTAATYWSLPVDSDRVTFVVDTSGSMQQPFGADGTRLDEAKRQLLAVLPLLGPKSRANIVAFGGDVIAWGKTLTKVDKRGQKAAVKFASALASRGPTDVHGALIRAFADPEVDTIFLLTDGRPSAGEIVEPNPLAAEVARWNASRGIRIHTVAIGGGSPLLERLARDSGGNYTVAR